MRSTFRFRRSILLASAVVFLSIWLPGESLAQQKTRLVVFEPQAIGVDPATVMATSQLLRNDLAATGQFLVVEEGEMQRQLGELARCYDSQCAAELGQLLGADKAVVGSLSRLGEKIIVELRLVDVASAQVEFSDRMASSTVEDLDTVMKRMAKGLASGKTSEKTAEVGMIVDQEIQEPRRRKNFFTVGPKVGYLFVSGDSWGKADRLLCLNWVTWYETPSFFVESQVGWRGQIDEDDGSIDVPIDFSFFYISGKSDFAPYLGGGIGIHWVTARREDVGLAENQDKLITKDGLALNIGGGLMSFRTYDFRFVVDLRYTVVFAELGEQNSHSGISLTFGITSPRRGGGERLGCCFFNF